MRLIGRLVWLLDHPAVGVYGTPIVLAVGMYLSVNGPGWWNHFFTAHALGFLLAFWIGSGFSFMWWMLRDQARQVPGGELSAAAIGLAGLLLVGGLGLLSDPSYLGVTVWPGLSLLRSTMQRRAQSESPDELS
jgi:hypothetical protein